MRILTFSAAATILALFCVTPAKSPPLALSNELHAASAASEAADDATWSVQTSGIDTNLRGVSAAGSVSVDANGAEHITVWASGSNGVILRSADLGKTWQRLHVAGGDSLDFRSVVAIDEKHAYVMSSGEGDKSRIYETKNGGRTWKLEFTGKQPTFFLDALFCASECYALSDPVDGKFVLLSNHNGTWNEFPNDGMPAALPGEGAFAASGTSLALGTNGAIYFGTGGAKVARVFSSLDRGKTWTATDTPMASGNASSGIFSVLAKIDPLVVLGGDYKDPNRTNGVAAYSADQGKTWQLAAQQPNGYRSAVVSLNATTILAIGPTGEDISHDNGANWKQIGSLDLNAAFALNHNYVWAVGPKGAIARLVTHKQ